ncbi:nonstructural protein 1a [Rabbit astrovirus TN/2208/2010]|uniref:nonstructural protein 1a n=1 Tax=Rabbit astrovirus TN/2208/2010 TaxID=1161132 RepID=UPI0002861CFD|nr:nonstructural protein 1a [Rabbit astrovirus TN/2208/2010]AFD34221.1 nonstructural protein 1a [Rabbit astrovirus TN/2208/2010]
MAARAGQRAYYHSPADEALGLGNPKARRILRRASAAVRGNLKKIFPDPIPLAIGYPLRGYYWPTTGFQRVISASGVVGDVYRTYVLDVVSGSEDWVEFPAEEDQTTAFFGQLVCHHERVKSLNRGLRNDLASSNLREELLRGELARLRREDQPSTTRAYYSWKIMWIMFKIVALSFTLGMIFHHASAETNITPPVQGPAREGWFERAWFGEYRDWHRTVTAKLADGYVEKDRALDDASEAAEEFRTKAEAYREAGKKVDQTLGEMWSIDWYKRIMTFLEWARVPNDHWIYPTARMLAVILPEVPWWALVATSLAVWRTFKDLHPLAALAFLVMATMTKMKFAALTVTPFLNQVTTISFLIIGTVYFIDPVIGILAALPLVPIIALVCCFLPDVDWRQMVFGHALITLCVVSCHFADLFGLGSNAVAAVLLCYRMWKAIDGFGAQTVEFRDSTGKVIAKTSNVPNWLWKFGQSAFRAKQKLRQKLRNTVAPFVRVCPESLCTVTAGDSQGTGFRCGNDIVTAKHVVAGLKVVDVTYNGATYQAGIRLELEKDIALLKLPPQLQTMPSLKISKKPVYDTITIVARDGVGILVATTEGVCHGDTISYACPTRDGMSGAPVVDINGHVLGVHQTNTGYTGGAVVLTQVDVQPVSQKELELLELRKQTEALKQQLADLLAGKNPACGISSPQSERPNPVVVLPDPVPEPAKIVAPQLPEDLRRLNEEINKMAAKSETILRRMDDFGQAIKDLEKQRAADEAGNQKVWDEVKKNISEQQQKNEEKITEFAQRMSQQDESQVIQLVRAAVQQEIQIVRDELNQIFFQKKKGKNKRGRGAKKSRPLLRKGQKMLTEEEYDELLSKGLSREALLDAVEEIVRNKIGYPEWSDPDDYSDDEDDLFEMGYNIRRAWPPDDFEEERESRERFDPDDEKYFSKYADWDSFSQGVKLVEVCDKPIWDDYNCGPCPQQHLSKYDPSEFIMTKVDMQLLKDYILALKTLVSASKDLSADLWKKHQKQLTDKMNEALFKLDMAAWENGLEPFVQRMKPRKQKNPQVSKNSQKGTKPSGPQKNAN